MSDDPLAQFRKKPPTDPAEYVAFATKDSAHCLRIREASGMVNSPEYKIYLNATYDGEKATHIILNFTLFLVLVTGQNLQKLIFAIENHRADFIQAFNPARWQRPTDPSATIIDSIEVKIKEGGSDNDEMEH